MTPEDIKEAHRLFSQKGGRATSKRKTEAVRRNAQQPRPNRKKRSRTGVSP